MADETTTDDHQGDGGQNDDGQHDDLGHHGDDGQGETAPPDIAALRKEAASHRTKARAAEAERDKLAGLVTSMQRNEVERLAEQKMASAEDLWSRVELAELLDADGAIDYARVTETVDRILTERPHWARPARPSGSADQGARSTSSKPAIGWAEVLRALS